MAFSNQSVKTRTVLNKNIQYQLHLRSMEQNSYLIKTSKRHQISINGWKLESLIDQDSFQASFARKYLIFHFILMVGGPRIILLLCG